jgi:tRNA A-37 threonylcarbamoyl transferase component Bud32
MGQEPENIGGSTAGNESRSDASATDAGATAATAAGLDGVLAEYLLAAEAGAAPDRGQFIALHPHLAGELRAFFEDEERLDRLARPLRAPETGAGAAIPTQDGSILDGTAAFAPGPDGAPPVRFFGDYELLEELGRGGMGVVYKARQIKLNRVVALKMILSGQFASAEDVKRFQVEGQNAARLDHPNIVPVYEVGRHRGQHYFTMKLILGGSLTRQIGHFIGDVRAAAGLVADTARAIHHAHQHGILHRDIKPGNILLDSEGRPQVTDFGLARRMEDEQGLTLSGAVLGSPRYMAPEQARGRKGLTVAADVYGLGAVLYELLTGRPPFSGETAIETLHQVREKEPTRPTNFAPNLDGDIEAVSLKCLEKDPQGRYATALALAEDLDRWLSGRPVSAKPVNRAQRAWRWCRRNPAISAMTTLLGLACVIGIWGVMAQWQKAKDAKARILIERRIASDASADSQVLHSFLMLINAVNPDMLKQAERDLDKGMLWRNPILEAAERHMLGKAYYAQGEWRLAERQLRIAFETRSQLLGGRDSRTRESRSALSTVLETIGDPEAQEQLFLETLEVEHAPGGAWDPHLRGRHPIPSPQN